MPIISIIIPIYESEKTIKRCIDSVISQTYQNIEIILIEDASQDASKEICADYSKKDERIKVIYHTSNKGVSHSRNQGIKLAKGEYITFIDSDDYVSSTYVESLYKLLKESDSDIAIIGNDEILNGQVVKKSNSYVKLQNAKETIERILEEKYITAVCWGKLYKRELFTEEIQFDVNLKIGEDLKIIIPIIEKCSKIIIDTKQVLYHYGVNVDSITQQTGKRQLWLEEIQLSRDIIEWTKQKYSSSTKYAMQRFVRVNITFIIKMIKENDVNLKNDIKQFHKNVNGYKFQYLLSVSVKLMYKIKLLLITFCPKLLVALYLAKS